MPEMSPKNLAIWAISKGLRLPERHIDRMSELYFLKQLLAQLEIDCVLDVGANRGQFASELRRIGYKGLMLSFEPIEAEFQYMSGLFKDDPMWRGYHMALGSEDDTKTITVPDLSVMTSFLEPVETLDAYHTETITVRTLSGLLPSILPDYKDRRIFLKMDTQGFDVEVFKGADGVLDSVLGLQGELSVRPLYKGMPHYLDALQVYEARGFQLFNLSVVLRASDEGVVELNCFMRRQGLGAPLEFPGNHRRDDTAATS